MFVYFSSSAVKMFILFIAQIIAYISNPATSSQYAAHTRHRCIPDITLAWSHELSTAPFASAPLIADVDADGYLDVISASFSGDIHVVSASDGQYKASSQWPYRLSHNSVHASPLQFDIDSDGMLDIVVFTSNGEILFLNKDGEAIENKYYQLEKISVERDWHLGKLTASQADIHDYILDSPAMAKENVAYVDVDPHVLATPVIDDVNQDGVIEELVIPVSYYFDLDDYSDNEHQFIPHDLNETELENYVVSALIYFNLTTMQPYRTIHLDLTQKSAEYPAFILTTPTLANLDNKPGLETVIGTVAGRLHVLDQDGRAVSQFPLPTDIIYTRVIVEDVNRDGRAELILQDLGGNVLCYDSDGNRLWETPVSGSKPMDMRVADVDEDGRLEIVVVCEDGRVWVLSGDSGQKFGGWPAKMGSNLSTPPLITRMHNLDLTILMSMSRDGNLYMLSTDQACRLTVNLGETTLVPLVAEDLLPSVPGIEIIVATKDGTLMCLMQGNGSDPPLFVDEAVRLLSWPSETKTHNDFAFLYEKEGLILSKVWGRPEEITSSTFPVEFEIIDTVVSAGPYKCQIFLGGILLVGETYSTPGVYSMIAPTPKRPAQGHLIVECRTKLGKVLRDVAAVRFHTTCLGDLQWLLISPTITMIFILLFLYGYPVADILPVTINAKAK